RGNIPDPGHPASRVTWVAGAPPAGGTGPDCQTQRCHAFKAGRVEFVPSTGHAELGYDADVARAARSRPKHRFGHVLVGHAMLVQCDHFVEVASLMCLANRLIRSPGGARRDRPREFLALSCEGDDRANAPGRPDGRVFTFGGEELAFLSAGCESECEQCGQRG